MVVQGVSVTSFPPKSDRIPNRDQRTANRDVRTANSDREPRTAKGVGWLGTPGVAGGAQRWMTAEL